MVFQRLSLKLSLKTKIVTLKSEDTRLPIKIQTNLDTSCFMGISYHTIIIRTVETCESCDK